MGSMLGSGRRVPDVYLIVASEYVGDLARELRQATQSASLQRVVLPANRMASRPFGPAAVGQTLRRADILLQVELEIGGRLNDARHLEIELLANGGCEIRCSNLCGRRLLEFVEGCEIGGEVGLANPGKIDKAFADLNCADRDAPNLWIWGGN